MEFGFILGTKSSALFFSTTFFVMNGFLTLVFGGGVCMSTKGDAAIIG